MGFFNDKIPKKKKTLVTQKTSNKNTFMLKHVSEENTFLHRCITILLDSEMSLEQQWCKQWKSQQ
jgi:hypothetical protein